MNKTYETKKRLEKCYEIDMDWSKFNDNLTKVRI